MILKKFSNSICTFLLINIILITLFYCPNVMGQISGPYGIQPYFPFNVGNQAFTTGGSYFNQLYNPFNQYGIGTLFGGTTATNPFWGLTANPYAANQYAANPYLAASTYYAAALLPADVVGAWSGTWTNTSALLPQSGDVSLTLVQATNDVAGTLIFLIGSTVKLACPVVGVIDVDLLSITGKGTLVAKTPIPYEIVLTAGVVGATMEGEYVIKETLLGNVIEEGTFSAAKL